MTRIIVTVNDETARRLEELARNRNSTPEELLAHHAEKIVLTHEEKVKAIGNRVIQEDAELLRRLA